MRVRDGAKAGIIAFHYEAHYYLLAIARVAGRSVVQLEKRARGGTHVSEGR
jgi:hypothetical protein